MGKTETRREFIGKIFISFGLIASGLALLRNGLAYIYPKITPKKKVKTFIAREDEISIGEAKLFNFAGRDLYLVRTEKGYKVFSATCTHLGCKVKWEAHRQRFFCPCHKGIFDINGNVLEGPPPRPLDEYEITIGNKLIYMWFA